MALTDAGAVYVWSLGSPELLRSRDGGRTWVALDIGGTHVVGGLRDGTILGGGWDDNKEICYASVDEGKTWQRRGAIDAPTNQAGSIIELRDGTLVWPLGYQKPGDRHYSVYAHRSTDGGRTWSRGYPICPGGEPNITQLRSGRLLAVCRNNQQPAADAWRVYIENAMPWRMWHRANRRDGLLPRHGLTSVHKNVLLADSDDGGITWKNVRPGTTDLDTMHGSAVELPDGRVVLIYVHRWPQSYGGEWAKTSRDGGNTWDEEDYYLSTPALGAGYSVNCLLPPKLADGKEGMILTVLGYRNMYHPTLNPERKTLGRLEAVRWRPLAGSGSAR